MLLPQRAADSCSACPPEALGPFQQAVPQSHRSQPVLGSVVISSQVQGFVLVLVKLHTALAGPVSDLAAFLPADPEEARKQMLQKLSG